MFILRKQINVIFIQLIRNIAVERQMQQMNVNHICLNHLSEIILVFF